MNNLFRFLVLHQHVVRSRALFLLVILPMVLGSCFYSHQ